MSNGVRPGSWVLTVGRYGVVTRVDGATLTVTSDPSLSGGERWRVHVGEHEVTVLPEMWSQFRLTFMSLTCRILRLSDVDASNLFEECVDVGGNLTLDHPRLESRYGADRDWVEWCRQVEALWEEAARTGARQTAFITVEGRRP